MTDPGKLKVFISYSRRDAAEFADELVAGLDLAGFAPFLDRQDIAAGEDWEARLGGLIEQSDTVVYVVSQESVKSERCQWEIDRTLERSKRLLPVIHKPVPDADIPRAFRRLQFVRFDGRGLARPLAELAEALRLDLDWIREHTRLGELAARWTVRGKPDSLLLRGDELDAAKQWAAARKSGAPEITEAQRTFLLASDEAENARLGTERARLEEMRIAQATTACQQKRAARLLWGIAALVLLMVGYVTWQGYDVSRREVAVFTDLAAQAMNDGNYDRAMRYALQAYPARGSLPWLTPFSTELEGKLAGGAQSGRLHRLLVGHSGQVNSAEFSPDGRSILTASDDGTMRIWDAETGAELKVFRPDGGEIKSAVFSPDGKRVLANVDYDGFVRIWDVEGSREVVKLWGHNDGVTTAAFDRTGKRVVTGSADNTARIWDAESGKELVVLKGHTFLVTSAAFNDAGDRVVTASFDKTARIWDARDGRELTILKGHDQFVNGAVFTRDGKRVLTSGSDGTTRIWDAETGVQLFVLQGAMLGEIWGLVQFDPTNAHVITAPGDGTLRVWDMQTGQPVITIHLQVKFRGGRGGRSVLFDAAGKRIVATLPDNTVGIWSLDSEIPQAILSGHTGGVTAASFSPDGKRVVSASTDGTVRIWDAEDPALVAVMKGHADSVERASFDADGKRVVTASTDKTARIWDAATRREIMSLGPYDYEVRDATFDPGGKRVATASSDIVRIWDADTGKETLKFKAHDARIWRVAYDPAGRRLVTAALNSTARIWNADTGERIANEQHPGWVRSAAFDPAGTRVISAIARNTAFIWDAATLKLLATLEGHTSAVIDGQFDATGKRVVTASWDGTARIWDARSGKELVRMTGPEAGMTSAQFDPTGTRVVTGGNDSVARLWDAQSGKEITAIRGHEKAVNSAAFSPDGRRVVTASSDNTARVWDVTWAVQVRGETLRERVCAEKLIGAAQEFTDAELENPILRGIDKDDKVERNPCLRRGPLSLDYWTSLPGKFWRAARRLAH